MKFLRMMNGQLAPFAKAVEAGLGGGSDNSVLPEGGFEDPDSPGLGLLAKMAAENPEENPPAVVRLDLNMPKGEDDLIEEYEDPDAPPPRKPSTDPKPKAEEEEEEEEDPDIGLPSLGDDPEPEPDDKKFDEKSFDDETERIIKAIEEKGHPGEVYRELRAELKALKSNPAPSADIQKLQTELAEAKIKAEEVEGLREKVKSVSSKYAALAAEESEEYIKQVVTPLRDIESVLDSMAEHFKVDKVALVDAVTEGNPAVRDEMLDDLEKKLGRRQIGRLERMADDFQASQRARKDILANAEKIIEQEKAARIEQEKKAIAKRRDDLVTMKSEVFERYSEKIPGFLDEEGNPTTVQRTALRKALAFDTENMSDGDIAYAIFTAQALPEVMKENARLRKALGEKTVKQGKATGKHGAVVKGTAPKTTPKSETAAMGLMDHMRLHMPK